MGPLAALKYHHTQCYIIVSVVLRFAPKQGLGFNVVLVELGSVLQTQLGGEVWLGRHIC